MIYRQLRADEEGRASQIRQIPDLAHGNMILIHFFNHTDNLKQL